MVMLGLGSKPFFWTVLIPQSELSPQDGNTIFGSLRSSGNAHVSQLSLSLFSQIELLVT